MKLGIEASNIRCGGGLTHLAELLRVFDPGRHGFGRIVVWSGAGVLSRLPETSWLAKRSHPHLDRNVFFRLFWQRFLADRAIRDEGVDVLFVPGTLHHLAFHPLVTMSHNMLPFEPKERSRYGPSYMGLRLRLLERKQGKVFTDADGVIFLTRYARETIARRLRTRFDSSAVIPHGVGGGFSLAPRPQRPIEAYSKERPFEILYVSIIDVYKHQDRLARVVSRLSREGFPVRLKLVGPGYPPERARLETVLREIDRSRAIVETLGAVPYERLASVYHAADLFAFPSSCENLPNILLEAMASGLPIACSSRGPMPGVLEDGGEYFDPEDDDDMYRALKRLLGDPDLRRAYAERSFAISRRYTWEACADATFSYLASFGPRP